ncbi:glutathione S-transferase family protein [Noviherbaspirillum sp. UKPF54]|uniref:glutathione S-transferase family protein n=1 Tax=Noviherbaspirillum sp. UKPF54 TaxID=2601898 RepID=UPI0011B1BA1B|nr:glutathione S-transferase [Noviherbaspirillum sp. UKPF54]QDZ27551.1 glutathione S-transferase family protein [Noviherbaspirillum sp. UKPF54]
MLKLCGFAASNYYNKVKFALLEKGVPFEEELVWTDRSPELLARSPLGKVPFFDTGHGLLCESQVMMEYLEAAYPEKPLMPPDPFAAAKVRELIAFMELHLELVARELFAEAFFGGKVSDEVKERAHKLLKRNAKAFAQLAKFAPYVAGAEFTMADCAGLVHLPLVSSTTKKIYGEDVLAGLPLQEYVAMMNERPAAQRVNADRKANSALFMQRFR